MLENGKHEMFVQKWHETDNKSEAYRYAYPKSLNWEPQSVNVKACEVSKIDKVMVRHAELKQEAADNHGITIGSLLVELNQIKNEALGADTPQCSAAVSSVMSKAKLVGLDITKVENKVVIEDESELDW